MSLARAGRPFPTVAASEHSTAGENHRWVKRRLVAPLFRNAGKIVNQYVFSLSREIAEDHVHIHRQKWGRNCTNAVELLFPHRRISARRPITSPSKPLSKLHTNR